MSRPPDNFFIHCLGQECKVEWTGIVWWSLWCDQSGCDGWGGGDSTVHPSCHPVTLSPSRTVTLIVRQPDCPLSGLCLWLTVVELCCVLCDSLVLCQAVGRVWSAVTARHQSASGQFSLSCDLHKLVRVLLGAELGIRPGRQVQ